MAQPLQRVISRPHFPGGRWVLGCGHEPEQAEPGPVGPFARCPDCPDEADLPPIPEPEPPRPDPGSIAAAIEHAQMMGIGPGTGQDALPGLGVPRRPVDAPSAPVGRDHPATARTAARRALPDSGSRRRSVYDYLVSCLPGGATDEEVEDALQGKHQSISAARRTLVIDGWVADSGQTRLLRNGNRATVWIATP